MNSLSVRVFLHFADPLPVPCLALPADARNGQHTLYSLTDRNDRRERHVHTDE